MIFKVGGRSMSDAVAEWSVLNCQKSVCEIGIAHLCRCSYIN